ncbi:hypothetical protein NL108_008364 [Boleophthalmus pectinirostris]|nr:hypothetical protein NL108_008364 [Boleophthalmus pectinirostris]
MGPYSVVLCAGWDGSSVVLGAGWDGCSVVLGGGGMGPCLVVLGAPWSWVQGGMGPFWWSWVPRGVGCRVGWVISTPAAPLWAGLPPGRARHWGGAGCVRPQ